VDRIRNGRRKREAALLLFLEAILTGTDTELAAASKAYFQHYKRNESRKEEIPERLTIDGSFLLHLAEHRGRSVPIPANIEPHIIRL